jgi:hypothetical protein
MALWQEPVLAATSLAKSFQQNLQCHTFANVKVDARPALSSVRRRPVPSRATWDDKVEALIRDATNLAGGCQGEKALAEEVILQSNFLHPFSETAVNAFHNLRTRSAQILGMPFHKGPYGVQDQHGLDVDAPNREHSPSRTHTCRLAIP